MNSSGTEFDCTAILAEFLASIYNTDSTHWTLHRQLGAFLHASPGRVDVFDDDSAYNTIHLAILNAHRRAVHAVAHPGRT
ncbi:hypothetical protein [Antrihabitans cavernicola]|uniref:Uncharacterized protein n=1 Tax=Antrihabitans cavernicola TaxID=2495913 RepID=A0A5A7S1U9_9NOCA|nr:hypothetical protein [Spelaeibacter cavernicola]KAA0016565.1 hypothetical protein FOY51_26100 [Spelaeibacter cavernicola]